MSKPNKWADQSEPNTPITVIAQDAIERRLNSVWRFAELAGNDADCDVEYVHQLRVCVRRASAALTIYAPLLPPSRSRRFRKALKSLRTAAGPARDLDVLSDRLGSTESRLPKEGLAELQKLVRAQRRKAQRKLKKGYEKANEKRIESSGKKLVAKIRWREEGDEASFNEYARIAFEPILNSFFAASRTDLSDVRNLHQMRIEGKSVRYAMELLSTAFEQAFREQIYPVFAIVQDKLGAINDHASAISFYRELSKINVRKACHKAIESMIAWEESKLVEAQDEFLAWWTPQRIESMQSQFETLLRPPCEDSNRVARVTKPVRDPNGIDSKEVD
ncbi:MAG: CHAD domain-containing protein [Rubripirellula sp.]